MQTRKFRKDLLERLKDPAYANGYLEVALEDADAEMFLVALKDVAEAQGGMSALARRAKVHRTGLYRFFSRRGNPTYKNLVTVVEALGYRISIVRKAKDAHSKDLRLKKAA